MASTDNNRETKQMTTVDTSSKSDNDQAAQALDRLTSTRVPALSARTAEDYAADIEHPGHYGGDTTYESIKVIEAWGLGFNTGNAVKYISRAGRKDGEPYEKDLAKAIYYLQQELGRVERQSRA